MGVVSVWILLISSGLLLYRQERIRYRGRRFYDPEVQDDAR